MFCYGTGVTSFSWFEEANLLVHQGTEELDFHSADEATDGAHEEAPPAAWGERAEGQQRETRLQSSSSGDLI